MLEHEPVTDAHLPPPSREGFAAVLAFLPSFEKRDFEAGEWRGGETDENGVIQMPWVEYDPQVLEFLTALSTHGWVVPFDWPSWLPETKRLAEPDGVEAADLESLQRLLTTIVRQDRFVEGNLASAFESGLVVRILGRIAELRP